MYYINVVPDVLLKDKLGGFYLVYMNKVKSYRNKKKEYSVEKINLKHNLWRIENDLNWIFKNNVADTLENKLCLYWLDIHLKNTLFPWVLKIERELKALFVFFYKKKYQSNDVSFLMDSNNYSVIKNEKDPIKLLESKLGPQKTIDEMIFTLTFGEFVNIIILFQEYIKNNMAKHLNLTPSLFSNVIKYLIILRNAIAHNKTIIKIRDEKNNKRFSLKKDFFDFSITKQEIDILSTNASGAIYVVKKILLRMDNESKAKAFVKDIKKNLKTFKKTMNDKLLYKKIIELIFLKYLQEIIKI